MASKISTGPNARPRDESISQTAPGAPDDATRPVEVDEETVRRTADKLTKGIDRRRKELRDDIELPQKGSA